MFYLLQILRSIDVISVQNQELMKKYRDEIKQRKRLHNELVDLKGQSSANERLSSVSMTKTHLSVNELGHASV